MCILRHQVTFYIACVCVCFEKPKMNARFLQGSAGVHWTCPGGTSGIWICRPGSALGKREEPVQSLKALCGKFTVHRVSNTNMNPVGRGSWTASSSQNGSSFNVQSHAETSTSQPCAHASGAATSETPCPASAWTYGTIAPILNYKIVKLCAQAWTKTAESTCANSNKQTHEFRKEAFEVPRKIFICHCMLESWGIASARLVSTCALIYTIRSQIRIWSIHAFTVKERRFGRSTSWWCNASESAYIVAVYI